MLTIPRTLAEPLDKVFGWALLLTSTSRSPLPPLEFAGGPRGVQIRCPTREATAEFRLDGGQVPETILAPWDLLVDTADTADTGRKRMVELRRENGRVLAAWHRGRVPRVVPYDTPAAIEDAWPDRPEQLTENPAELLRALADAAATTTPGPSRYALRCLQLDGTEGRIVATDGRQLLVESGFAFPWEGRLLIPASRVFGSAELQADGPVRVGTTDDRFWLETGRWTFSWRLDRDGCFPDVERLLPDPAAAVARLELAASDLALLAEHLPRLPGDALPHAPVTLDIDGTAAVRAQGRGHLPEPQAAAGVELVLSGARRSGEPIHLHP